jgi:hypothetical protein
MIALLHAAAERSVTLFDTAENHGPLERLLGVALDAPFFFSRFNYSARLRGPNPTPRALEAT